MKGQRSEVVIGKSKADIHVGRARTSPLIALFAKLLYVRRNIGHKNAERIPYNSLK